MFYLSCSHVAEMEKEISDWQSMRSKIKSRHHELDKYVPKVTTFNF